MDKADGESWAGTELRQVSKRVSLEPGIYVIVPCTKEVDTEAEFMLRVFTETPSKLRDVPTHVADLLEDEEEEVP